MADNGIPRSADTFKVCTSCSLTLPHSEFFLDKRRGTSRPTCKTCGKESYRAWREGRLSALKEQRALTRKRLKKETLAIEIVEGRVCKSCNERKSLSAFHANVNYHNGYTSCCKACQTAKRRARRQANPFPHRIKTRKRHYKKAYGISAEAVDALLKAQDMKCAICTRDLTGGRAYAGPYVDHDHLTGKIRGILCFACNSGLGRFGDSINMLLAAVAYLRRNSPDGESG